MRQIQPGLLRWALLALPLVLAIVAFDTFFCWMTADGVRKGFVTLEAGGGWTVHGPYDKYSGADYRPSYLFIAALTCWLLLTIQRLIDQRLKPTVVPATGLAGCRLSLGLLALLPTPLLGLTYFLCRDYFGLNALGPEPDTAARNVLQATIALVASTLWVSALWGTGRIGVPLGVLLFAVPMISSLRGLYVTAAQNIEWLPLGPHEAEWTTSMLWPVVIGLPASMLLGLWLVRCAQRGRLRPLWIYVAAATVLALATELVPWPLNNWLQLLSGSGPHGLFGSAMWLGWFMPGSPWVAGMFLAVTTTCVWAVLLLYQLDGLRSVSATDQMP